MEFLERQTLVYEDIILVPLVEEDFDAMYAVASDPMIWKQHPNSDRWQKTVFKNFFEGAMASRGAFKVCDIQTGKILGCTRFYDYDAAKKEILIGYTFYATEYWGKGINLRVKRLMLDFIFQFVETVYFHIGSLNIRSQLAIQRLGAEKIRELEVTYYGEQPKQNFEYRITKEQWGKIKQQTVK